MKKWIKIGCFAGVALVILPVLLLPLNVRSRERHVLDKVVKVVAEAQLRQWADSIFCNSQNLDFRQDLEGSLIEEVGKKNWGERKFSIASKWSFIHKNKQQICCMIKTPQGLSSLIVFSTDCSSDEILHEKNRYNSFYEVGDKIFWTGFVR